MIRPAIFPALILLSACGGRSDEAALQNAANQSDPAAAAVLNQAAEAGVDPQVALNAAGRAQAETEIKANSTIQAKPNLAQSPNRPDGTQPPQKIDVEADEPHANASTEHNGH